MPRLTAEIWRSVPTENMDCLKPKLTTPQSRLCEAPLDIPKRPPNLAIVNGLLRLG